MVVSDAFIVTFDRSIGMAGLMASRKDWVALLSQCKASKTGDETTSSSFCKASVIAATEMASISGRC